MKNFRRLCVLLLLYPISVSADIYRYVDKNGTVYFVDDMSKVPDAYVDQVERYAVPKDSEKSQKEAVTDPNVRKPEDVQQAITLKTPKKEDAGKANEDPQGDALVKKKKELDEEYTALMKEKDELSASIAEWSKRYKTRARKSVARAKLKQLEEMKMQWEEKYKAWEKKKMALENK